MDELIVKTSPLMFLCAKPVIVQIQTVLVKTG